jgi:hypothetical protein
MASNDDTGRTADHCTAAQHVGCRPGQLVGSCPSDRGFIFGLPEKVTSETGWVNLRFLSSGVLPPSLQ